MKQNERPLEESKNPDLRNSLKALERAALRARELAIRTRTPLIVSRNGVIEKLMPWLDADETGDATEGK